MIFACMAMTNRGSTTMINLSGLITTVHDALMCICAMNVSHSPMMSGVCMDGYLTMATMNGKFIRLITVTFDRVGVDWAIT